MEENKIINYRVTDSTQKYRIDHQIHRYHLGGEYQWFDSSYYTKNGYLNYLKATSIEEAIKYEEELTKEFDEIKENLPNFGSRGKFNPNFITMFSTNQIGASYNERDFVYDFLILFPYNHNNEIRYKILIPTYKIVTETINQNKVTIHIPTHLMEPKEFNSVHYGLTFQDSPDTFVYYAISCDSRIKIPNPSRYTKDYNEWRQQVLKDGKCACCGGDKELEAHHIYSYAKHKYLQTDIENGIILCKECHSKYHSYYGNDSSPKKLFKFLQKFGGEMDEEE